MNEVKDYGIRRLEEGTTLGKLEGIGKRKRPTCIALLAALNILGLCSWD